MREPKSVRILAIDDSPSVLKLVEQILRAYGNFDIVTASNIIDGLTRASICDPDLVIVDFELGDGTGLDFLQTFRQNTDAGTEQVPVIMLTGSVAADLEGRARKAGANAFLTKPVDARDLCETVTALLSAPGTGLSSTDGSEQTIASYK